jgi:hypothetical protein
MGDDDLSLDFCDATKLDTGWFKSPEHRGFCSEEETGPDFLLD